VPRLQRKGFDKPDEIRRFPSGSVEVINLDEIAVSRFVFQPGWTWSKDVGPIAGTKTCQHRHVGYTISGRLAVQMEDGTTLVIQPGDGYEIPPGHLAHVDYTLYTVFFGLDILCLSYLVLRSRFVPRVFAVLLAADGLAYLIYGFTDILAPSLSAGLTPWIQLPAPLAEGGLSLWLLAFGVNLAWWTKRAADRDADSVGVERVPAGAVPSGNPAEITFDDGAMKHPYL